MSEAIHYPFNAPLNLGDTEEQTKFQFCLSMMINLLFYSL